MVSRGEAVRLGLQLLPHLGPQPETALKAEVKQLTGGKGQRLFCLQSFQSVSPSFQHRSSHGSRTVSWTPEDLRSQNLKSTEVQSAVLKDRNTSKHQAARPSVRLS